MLSAVPNVFNNLRYKKIGNDYLIITVYQIIMILFQIIFLTTKYQNLFLFVN